MQNSLFVGWLKATRVLAKEAALVGVIVFLFFGVQWVYNKWTAQALRPEVLPQTSIIPPITAGASLRIKGQLLTSPRISVVLLTAPNCPYCQKHLAVHQSLIATAKRSNVPFRVSVRSRAEAASYLAELGAAGGAVDEWADLSVSVRATPTILIVDKSGIIRRIWTGAIGQQREAQVTSIVEGRVSLDPYSILPATGQSNLTPEKLHALRRHRLVSILDIRERSDFLRGHEATAINIPLVELDTRIGKELDRTHLVVVDCGRVREQSCVRSLAILGDAGFESISLNAGTGLENSCFVTEHSADRKGDL